MLKYCTQLTCLLAALSPACHNLMLEPLDDAATCSASGMGAPTPDMAVAPPKCAAAKGLAGDNLLCVDFDKVTALNTLTGWDFTSQCPAGWTLSNGKLQVNNFPTFMGSCLFTMPTTNLNDAANLKYQSITLSVVQRVHLDEAQQSAQILLGLDQPSTRLFAQMTGREQRVQWTQTIARTDLPVAIGSIFQPLFKTTSGAQVGTLYQGWLIESIAVTVFP